jgi:hypothetical protein
VLARRGGNVVPGFLVRRLRWSDADYFSKLRHRLPGEVAVASFTDRADAEADLRRREGEARQGVNPFSHGEALCYQTSLDAPRFHDWLLDAGLEPPAPNKKGAIDWVAWWARASKRMTEEQKARVWQGLDRVRFFDLVEQPRRTGFVVVEVNFEYNDEYNAADEEGGEVNRVYLSREKAEAHLRKLGPVLTVDDEDEESDDDADRHYSYRRDNREAPVSLTGPVGPLPHGMHHEIIEVELED